MGLETMSTQAPMMIPGIFLQLKRQNHDKCLQNADLSCDDGHNFGNGEAPVKDLIRTEIASTKNVS